MTKIFQFPTPAPKPKLPKSRHDTQFVNPKLEYDRNKFFVLEAAAICTNFDAASRTYSFEPISIESVHAALLGSLDDPKDFAAMGRGYRIRNLVPGTDITEYLQAAIGKCHSGEPVTCICTEQTYIFFGAL